jgi:hypothetical protein
MAPSSKTGFRSAFPFLSEPNLSTGEKLWVQKHLINSQRCWRPNVHWIHEIRSRLYLQPHCHFRLLSLLLLPSHLLGCSPRCSRLFWGRLRLELRAFNNRPWKAQTCCSTTGNKLNFAEPFYQTQNSYV